MATVITSIGAGTGHDANNTISAVSGAGPWTVTVANGALCVAGDALWDEHATPRKYLITGVSVNDLTVRDSEGVGSAPDNSGTSQAQTKRYYNGASPITSWEADLDDTGLYVATNVAQGECYNDAAFDEAVTINGGGTVGLASITLTVPVGERHSGIAGPGGARIVVSSSYTSILEIGVGNVTVEWLEINAGSRSHTRALYINTVPINTTMATIQRMIVHNLERTGTPNGLVLVAGAANVHNNLFYDINITDAGTAYLLYGPTSSARNIVVSNNTLYKSVSASGNSFGVQILDHAGKVVKNNLVTDSHSGSGEDYDITSYSNATSATNASSDSTAPSPIATEPVSSAVEFVSNTAPYDLHLAVGAECINTGTDLGTTPTGVNFDIDGRDRDAMADVWDIGADEYVAVAGGGPFPHYSRRSLSGGMIGMGI